MARLEIDRLPKSFDAVRLITDGGRVVPVGTSDSFIVETEVGTVSAVLPPTCQARSGDSLRPAPDRADIHLFHPQPGQRLAA